MIVELQEECPFLYKGNPTFYQKGDKFEVVEEKELKVVGKCYRLKKYGCIFDGWIVAKQFKVIEI